MAEPTAAEVLEGLTQWKVAYKLAFSGIIDSAAFEDLAAFCHERETCVVPGDREQSYVLEGRRQVMLRIRNFIDLTPEQLFERHARYRSTRQ